MGIDVQSVIMSAGPVGVVIIVVVILFLRALSEQRAQFLAQLLALDESHKAAVKEHINTLQGIAVECKETLRKMAEVMEGRPCYALLSIPQLEAMLTVRKAEIKRGGDRK